MWRPCEGLGFLLGTTLALEHVGSQPRAWFYRVATFFLRLAELLDDGLRRDHAGTDRGIQDELRVGGARKRVLAKNNFVRSARNHCGGRHGQLRHVYE